MDYVDKGYRMANSYSISQETWDADKEIIFSPVGSNNIE
jgi:hypothetical protein